MEEIILSGREEDLSLLDFPSPDACRQVVCPKSPCHLNAPSPRARRQHKSPASTPCQARPASAPVAPRFQSAAPAAPALVARVTEELEWMNVAPAARRRSVMPVRALPVPDLAAGRSLKLGGDRIATTS
jgi:hypothetical protein